MKQRRALLVPLVIAAVAALVTGCSGTAAADSDASAEGGIDTLRVATIDMEGSIPLLLGMEQGIFEKHGIEIETAFSPSFDGTMAAVMNGQADVGFAASPPMVRAIAKGAPITAVGQTAAIAADEVANVDAIDPAITSPKDLEGRTVAVGSLNDLGSIGVKVAVAKDGGDPALVKFAEVPLAQRLAALQEGRIDAAIFLGAASIEARETDGVNVIFQYTSAFPAGSPLDMYFSQVDYADKNAEVLERFRAALTEASEYANANEEAVRAEIARLFAEVPGGDHAAEVMDLTHFSTEIDPEALMGLQDAMVTYGGLEAAVPAERFFSFENKK